MQCSSTIASVARHVIATIAAALVIAIGGFAPQAHAVTAAEVEAQAQEVLVQINAMQAQLDEYSEQYFRALYEYQAAVEARDAVQEHIDELTAEIAEIQDRLGARARDMYREGPLSFLDLLLGSASFEEFTTNWELLNRINESDAEMSVSRDSSPAFPPPPDAEHPAKTNAIAAIAASAASHRRGDAVIAFIDSSPARYFAFALALSNTSVYSISCGTDIAVVSPMTSIGASSAVTGIWKTEFSPSSLIWVYLTPSTIM